MKFIIRWGINAVALYAAIAILPGRLSFESHWGLAGIVFLALVFGLVNALFRPLLKFLSCPLIILTLGLFTLVINTLLFALTAWIGHLVSLNLIISVPFWWNAFLGALIVSIISIVLSLILRDGLKDKKLHKKSQ
jgi:putative membrane protein